MTIQDLYNQIEALIETEYAKMDKAAQVNHIARRKAIDEAIAELWAKASVKPALDAGVGNVIYVSANEAKRYGRLDRLDESVKGIVKVGAVTDIRDIEYHGRNVYQLQYDGAAWVYQQGYGLPVTGGAKVKLVAGAIYSDFYGNAFPELVKRNWAAYYDTIMSEVVRGLNQGHSYSKMARIIKERADTNYAKAIRLAATEAHRIQSQAYLDSLGILDEAGVEYGKMWLSTIDSKTREDHITMDGRFADDNGIFHLPDGASGPAPGQTGSAANDINCIPSDSIPIGFDTEKLYRRAYDGDLIEIETKSGALLRVTPNHPVLTNKGWVAGDLINESHDIVGVSLGWHRVARKPNIKHSPPTAAQLFNLFSITTHERVNGANEQFHGDGRQGYVDIISIKSHLWDYFSATVYKPLAKLPLSLAYICSKLLSSGSFIKKLGRRTLNAPNRIMCFFRKAGAFFRSGVSHSLEHSFGSVAGSDAVNCQDLTDRASGDLQLDANRFFGNSAKVFFDNVVSVKRVPFVGQVYNLQTKQGYYGIYHSNGNMSIVHNCRCTAVTTFDGQRPSERRVRDEGIVPFETFRERLARGGDIPLAEIRKAK